MIIYKPIPLEKYIDVPKITAAEWICDINVFLKPEFFMQPADRSSSLCIIRSIFVHHDIISDKNLAFVQYDVIYATCLDFKAYVNMIHRVYFTLELLYR